MALTLAAGSAGSTGLKPRTERLQRSRHGFLPVGKAICELATCVVVEATD